MKTPVAIALIVCGTLLLIAPSVFDQVQRTQYLQVSQATSGHRAIPAMKLMSESIAGFVAYGCGGLMIATAAYFSFSPNCGKGMPKSVAKPATAQTAAST